MENKVVSANELTEQVMKYLNEYKEDIEDTTKKVMKENSQQALNKVKLLAPKRRPEYYRGFKIRLNNLKSKNFYGFTIYNEQHYRLTHLLEFGHYSRSGSWVEGKKHITTTELEYIDKTYNDLQNEIKKGG